MKVSCEIIRTVPFEKYLTNLARLHLMHKTCWIDSTLGSPDWTVRLNAYTVHDVPARIKHLINLRVPLRLLLLSCIQHLCNVEVESWRTDVRERTARYYRTVLVLMEDAWLRNQTYP